MKVDHNLFHVNDNKYDYWKFIYANYRIWSVRMRSWQYVYRHATVTDQTVCVHTSQQFASK